MTGLSCVWSHSRVVCGQPAAKLVVLGCVHEHLSPEAPTCHRCAAELAVRIAVGDMLCVPCRRGSGEEVEAVIVDVRDVSTG